MIVVWIVLLVLASREFTEDEEEFARRQLEARRRGGLW
jgi:hypothetical protein